MKTTLIALIAAIAVTNAAHARTWAWFHGDIGVSSPFVASSNSPANTVSTPHTTKAKAFSKPVAMKNKSKLISHRIAAR